MDLPRARVDHAAAPALAGLPQNLTISGRSAAPDHALAFVFSRDSRFPAIPPHAITLWPCFLA
jgi:hypothetical protein